jgi:putative tricarboxylic transport membrane protein
MTIQAIIKKFITFDHIVAILSIPIAIFLIVVELKTPKANIPQAIGPDVMPIGILSLIIVSAIILFINATYEQRKSSRSADVLLTQAAEIGHKKYKTVIMVILGLVAYAALLNQVGFIICTTLLVIFEAQIFERGRWVRNVMVSITFSVVVYFVFVNLLNVMLPAGLLGW